jgi:Tfp pilus assembly protein FimT
MVVLAIIAIMSAVAVPNVMAWLPSHRLRSAATDLHDNLQLVRLAAVKNNRSISINFAASPDRYWFSIPNKPTQTIRLDSYGSGVRFEGPSGQTFQAATITYNNRGLSNQGYTYLSNNTNSGYYRIGPLSSGVINYHHYNGSSWE